MKQLEKYSPIILVLGFSAVVFWPLPQIVKHIFDASPIVSNIVLLIYAIGFVILLIWVPYYMVQLIQHKTKRQRQLADEREANLKDFMREAEKMNKVKS